MERRVGLLTLSLILVFCLGLVNLSFSDDAIRLENWRQRAHEGNFARGIAGVYLIWHHTDDSFRLISLTAGGNWASTHSFQHDTATGAPTGIVRVRYVVQFSKDLQSVTGTQKVRGFPLDQDPFDPEAVPALEFDSLFTGRRVTVEAE